LKLQPVAEDRWGARSALLVMSGTWNLDVIMRASGMNDISHSFIVDSTTLTSDTTSTGASLPLWSVLFVAALLLAAASQLTLPRIWQGRLQTSSLVLVIAAFVASTVPFYLARANDVDNPLAQTPQVLAAGKATYEKSCVACHGLTGRGDGPAARSLPSLPADFTQPHFASHIDADLFRWIKEGKPGTPMPAFGDNLSDEQIWQVLSYIRQIYQEAQP
jgi:mono/diheme cytochrome c family protein